MWDVEHRAEHITDAVARTHRHPRGERPHRQPRAHLAIEAGRQIRGIGLDPGQTAGEQRQPVQGLGIGERIGLAGADALDAMIDRSDPGREPKPLGRVHGGGWIEHHRTRNDLRMPEQLLDPAPLVGDAGNGAELAGREGRRHRDLPY